MTDPEVGTTGGARGTILGRGRRGPADATADAAAGRAHRSRP